MIFFKYKIQEKNIYYICIKQQDMQLTYKILMNKEPEGKYTVTVPALPGCITYGNDVDHAILMAQEAIEIYIEELQSRGEDIPDDSSTLEYSLNLTA